MTTSSGAVLVTGASSGMGKACALRLDQAGYIVFAGVRKQRDAQMLKQEGSSRLIPVILDVTNEQSIADTVSLICETVGDAGLVGLVNNACVAVTAPSASPCSKKEKTRPASKKKLPFPTPSEPMDQGGQSDLLAYWFMAVFCGLEPRALLRCVLVNGCRSYEHWAIFEKRKF